MPYTFDFVKSKYLKKWGKLDAKQKELSFQLDAIYKTSAVGQAPPCFHTTADKLLKVEQDKALIWNEIRGFIIPGTNYVTLWQMAIKHDKVNNEVYYNVNLWGKEEHVGFTVQDIEKLYSI